MPVQTTGKNPFAFESGDPRSRVTLSERSSNSYFSLGTDSDRDSRTGPRSFERHADFRKNIGLWASIAIGIRLR